VGGQILPRTCNWQTGKLPGSVRSFGAGGRNDETKGIAQDSPSRAAEGRDGTAKRYSGMPLTFQPFADVPAIKEIEKELGTNLSSSERTISNALGAVLLGASMGRGGILKWLLRLAGGALLARGITGHCAVYERLGIDTNEAHARPAKLLTAAKPR